MSASAWTATKNGTASTPTLKQLKPWRHRLAGICRGVFHQHVAIGVVRQPAANTSLIWRSANGRSGRPAQPVAHLEDDELIENLARFADGTLTEAAVKARHHLSNEEWAALGDSDRLVELVEACKATAATLRRHQEGKGANRDRRRTADSRQNYAGPQRQRTAHH